MALRRCHRLCNVMGLAKFVFLTCVSLIACGLIVASILAYLIILPYHREAQFQPTSCRYLREDLHYCMRNEIESYGYLCKREKCRFPCYVVRVNVSGSNLPGVLFENYLTYADMYEEGCSSSPCLSEASENVEMTRRYIHTLRRRSNFSCYFRHPAPDTDSKRAVLLTKIYTKRQAQHCAIWPAFAVSLGSIVLIGTHYCAGCTVWTKDKTVIA